MSKVFNRGVKVNGKVEADAIENIAGTVTAAAAAATLAATAGKITSEALTTAQNAIYALTLTNSKIDANSIVLVTVADGTNTQGTPMVGQVKPGSGTCLIEVINKHATAEALNGTVVISFLVINPNVDLD